MDEATDSGVRLLMLSVVRQDERERILAIIRDEIAQRKALGLSHGQMQIILDRIAWEAGVPAVQVRIPNAF